MKILTRYIAEDKIKLPYSINIKKRMGVMARFCTKCGYALDENGICPHCGHDTNSPEMEKLCPDCGVPFNVNGICPRCGNRLDDMEKAVSKGADVNMIYSDDEPTEEELYDLIYKDSGYEEKKRKSSAKLFTVLVILALLAAGVFFLIENLPGILDNFGSFSADGTATGTTTTANEGDSVNTESTTAAPQADYPPKFDYYTATSCYDKNEDNTSSADDAFDGNTETCWQDGVSGYGEGECLTAYAYSDQLVYSVTVYNGYQKTHVSTKYYKYNSRIKEFTVYYDGGSETFVLEDTKAPQTFVFSSPIITDYITIEINSVYKGSKYKDTCLTDIIFS